MQTFARHPSSPRARTRLGVIAGLLALLLSLVLVCLPRADAAQQSAQQKPSFVVIQVDDATLDQLYATFSPGGIPIQAMPNTLALIAGRGITFNRYYVPYPLCCPSRVSLLTGRYSHNNNVRGNVPPNGGFTGFKARQAYTHNLAPWLQAAGYRTVHIGKFLNGYGDEPFDDGRDVPPGWNAWHSVLRADTNHYFYGYTLNDNGVLDGPFGDPGSWDTREYGERDDFGCPNAPLNGKPCFYETDVFNRIAWEELTGTSAARRDQSPPPGTTTSSPERPTPTAARKASTRAASTTSPASSAKRPTSRCRRSTPTGSTTRRHWSRCARSTRE